MMRLTAQERPHRDSVVPMINVAFLLLIFFLMTAVLAPPDALTVALPEAETPVAEASPDVLVILADGNLALGNIRGDAVFEALPDGPLQIRADAGLEGAVLARIMKRLAAQGVTSIELLTAPR